MHAMPPVNQEEVSIVTRMIGPWEVRCASWQETVSAKQCAEMISVLQAWQKVFPPEDTYARAQFGTPSLLARIDCAPSESGLGIYEVEERPAGLGATVLMNSDFAARLAAWRATVPDFRVVVSSRRGAPGTDDYLWCPVAEEGYTGPVLVRAEPDETEYHHLAPRSIATLISKGDKSYGVPLGWWHEVKAGESLPWDEGFCLKPIQGSKCRGVHVFAPKHDRPGGKAGSGTSTRSQVERALDASGRMYLQAYQPPLRRLFEGKEYRVIWRFYFGYEPTSRAWVPLGGVWTGRVGTLRIHGSKDSLFGPLVV